MLPLLPQRKNRLPSPGKPRPTNRLPFRSNTFWVEQLEARCLLSALNRTIDGTANNPVHPDWGSANTDLMRIASPAYSDGISAMAWTSRPSPREISNAVAAQTGDILNDRHMSDWVWQWGQFLDHDLDLTPQPGDPPEHANIPVPTGDPFFDPEGTGTQVIGFDRSVFDPATGTGTDNPRQQPNVITSYIDGSQVYGSDDTRAGALRTYVGGRLKTSPGNLLPYNSAAYFGELAPLPNANSGPFPDDQLFVAGDVRANENVGLTAVQTLFVREHNRWANVLASIHPRWDDETLYQAARKIVGAEIEVITYKEFLPALMGPYAPSIDEHYDPSVNPSISTEFSTAAFRVGHTLLSNQILRIENDGRPDPRGPISLADSFFNPTLLTNRHDMNVILKGLASQEAEEVDNQLVDGVRNFLFGPPGAGGFDLASLNIQRGRDHGLSDYNTTRVAFGLPAVVSFADITSKPDLQDALAAEYGSVDNIDLWVGALAEDHLPNASIGPLLTTIFQDQFTRLRDGDWFYFEHDPSFSRLEVRLLKQTTLADVIRRNTGITSLQRDVFFVGGRTGDGGNAELPTVEARLLVAEEVASAVTPIVVPSRTAPAGSLDAPIEPAVSFAAAQESGGIATAPRTMMSTSEPLGPVSFSTLMRAANSGRLAGADQSTPVETIDLMFSSPDQLTLP
jgi:hypothetical protein